MCLLSLIIEIENQYNNGLLVDKGEKKKIEKNFQIVHVYLVPQTSNLIKSANVILIFFRRS